MLNTLRAIFKIPFLENLLRRFTYNQPVDSFVGKLTPNYHLYEPGSYRQFNRNGITLKADISDFIGYMAYFGFKDEAVSDFYKLVKPGYIVLDIGANIGSTVLKTAQQLHGSGRVIGFEPDPENFKKLQENVSLNRFPNIEIYNFGLGDQNSVQKLHIPTSNNRGGNRINNKAEEHFSLIEIHKLDDFILDKGNLKIDLIKIDVEGFELKVFKGAENLLRQQKPILFIEVDDDNLKAQGDSAQQLIHFLTVVGYHKIQRADTKDTITAHFNFNRQHFDIICFPAS